jgi:hypothetical protein
MRWPGRRGVLVAAAIISWARVERAEVAVVTGMVEVVWASTGAMDDAHHRCQLGLGSNRRASSHVIARASSV